MVLQDSLLHLLVALGRVFTLKHFFILVFAADSRNSDVLVVSQRLAHELEVLLHLVDLLNLVTCVHVVDNLRMLTLCKLLLQLELLKFKVGFVVEVFGTNDRLVLETDCFGLQLFNYLNHFRC
jgi:hypothetical protein